MKIIKTFLICFCFLFGAPSVMATHIRGGTLSYEVTNPTTKTVRFKMRLGLRTVLSGEEFRLYFGNGQSALPSSTTILGSGLTDSSGAASSYSLYEFTYSHTYGAVANTEFTAYYLQCCRISSLAYQADTDIRLQTLVRFSDPISPTVNFPAIIQFYQGQANSLDLKTFINDASLDPFQCRKATDSESGFVNQQTIFGRQLTVSQDCILSWNLGSTSLTTGFPKYAVGIMIESKAGTGAKVPFDFIVELIVGSPLQCNPTGPLSITAYSGNPISASFQLSGGQSGATVSQVTTTLVGKGLVTPNAALSTTLPAPYTYSYTILPGDTSFSTLIQWRLGVQTCSQNIQVTVLQNRPPDAQCKNVDVSADGNCQAVVTAAQVNNGSLDPDNQALTYSLSPSGPFIRGDTQVTLTATDTFLVSDTCTATVNVVDDSAPTVTCVASLAVLVNTEFDILDNASDNCEADLSQSISQSVTSMDTSGVYDNFVTVSATDSAGNVGTCTLPRLVVYDPLTCATTESLSLAGYLGDTVSTIFQVQGGPTGTQVSAVTSAIDGKGAVSTSAAATDELPASYVYEYTIQAGDTDFNTQITWESGTLTCSQDVQVVILNQAPVAECQDVTVSTDGNCQAVVVAAPQFDNGSFDFEGSPLTYAVSPEGPFGLGNTAITLAVTDDLGVSDTCTAVVSVIDDSAPTVTCAEYILVPVNTAFDISAGTASDNCDANPVVTQSATTMGTPGVYIDAVTLSATDDTGNVGSCTLPMLVVYDPSAGFVTGGGWFESPAGAYALDESVVGKASFGFVSKYNKGQTVPGGNTQFTFKAATLSFHSTAYEWLVITGSKCAKYKGSGMINGTPGYGFMLTACDVAEPGSGVDTFRIKIWQTSDDAVVYDNQMGQSDDSYDGTAIQGNIQVHNSKKRLRP